MEKSSRVSPRELGSKGMGQEFVVWTQSSEAILNNDQELTIVGRLWSSRSTNAKMAIETMINIWGMKGRTVGNILDSQSKIFAFRFENARDKAKVLEEQPWHFDRHIWCFNDPNSDGKILDVPLFHVPFWVRVYELPFDGRTSIENVKNIGNLLGGFVGVDDSSCAGLQKAVRIRVMHDVRVPLRKHVPIMMKNGIVSNFDIKYEKLPIFCYGCGLLGHGEKDRLEGPYEEEELLFGEGLRASTWKPIKVESGERRGKARDLRATFDREALQKEQDDVYKLVEKIQSIAVSLKLKRAKDVDRKGEKVGDRALITVEQEVEEGGRLNAIREKGVVVDCATGKGLLHDLHDLGGSSIKPGR